MDRIPTIEEYKKGIWYFYYDLLVGTAPEEKLKAYFNGDEATEEIHRRYRNDISEYKDEEKFPHTATAWEGAEASVAYCLSMMFE